MAMYAEPPWGAVIPLSGGSGKAAARIIRSLSSRVMAVSPPLIRGLALSSDLGWEYLTAVHTSTSLAST